MAPRWLDFQRQFQLRRIELFRLRPELRASVILNLTFQLGEQCLQLGYEGVLLGPNRLLMLTCGALHRGLEPGRFQRRLLGCKGLHNLGRKVRKLAEIEGLRHAPFYPIRARKPNKTGLNSAR